MHAFKPLERNFYQRDTIEVAKDLLGKFLVHHLPTEKEPRVGKIVEVEAYLGQQDLACHASKGVTPRTRIMFGPAGFAYIYLIYGIHHCFNVVTEQEGVGAAVLIRAIEPIDGIGLRTQGPGLLCKALDIDKHLNGEDLLNNRLFIANSNDKHHIQIIAKPRIGVHYAKEWADKPLRFYVKGNSFISKP
ncbi:MAG TPA: DNA-3-methyladenine glycosylase [Legionellaceae bacterium]|nr:DNA-3-methyladenine glycosylase [Legionellaceae bacterium]